MPWLVRAAIGILAKFVLFGVAILIITLKLINEVASRLLKGRRHLELRLPRPFRRLCPSLVANVICIYSPSESSRKGTPPFELPMQVELLHPPRRR